MFFFDSEKYLNIVKYIIQIDIYLSIKNNLV